MAVQRGKKFWKGWGGTLKRAELENNNLDYSFKSDVAYSDMLTIQEEKGIKFVEKFYR